MDKIWNGESFSLGEEKKKRISLVLLYEQKT